MINQKRYLAQVIIEADSPLKIASGERDLFLDSPVQKDWNGLPMILGTSITGVLRHSFENLNPDKKGSFLNQLFGYQERNKDGEGSRLMISNAHLLDETYKVNEGLMINKTPFLKEFDNLPIREHTAITDKGVAKKSSKFDEEVVFKGSRFKFEMELISENLNNDYDDKGLLSEIDNDKDAWEEIIDKLYSPIFRLGGGTTKGFGKIKVISINQRIFNLDKEEDIKAYQEKSASLNEKIKDSVIIKSEKNEESYIKYNLKITPEDFFLFGSGFGDDDADMTPVKEDIILWDSNNKGKFSKQQLLMPATSIKGALSHRTAFYYNKLNKNFADEVNINDYVMENNKAVSTLFGIAKDSKFLNKEIEYNKLYLDTKKENKINGSKGKILISDMFQKDREQEKVFDHVKIDRFTGGAIDGALFQEKVIAQKDEWNIEILLNNKDLEENIIKAFELALKDIATGMLPLGGSVNKGHGVFIGKLLRNGVEL